MRLRDRVTVAALLAFVPAASSAAQQPTGLPGWVDDAIAFGQKNRVHAYYLWPRGLVLKAVGEVTTPFARVAIAASDAQAKLLPFTRDSVTAAMIEPVLRVRAWPILGERVTSHHDEVEHLIIAPPKAQRPDDAIQPLSIASFTETIMNNLGARTERLGKVASFPLSALRTGLVIVVVYDSRRLEIPIDREMIDALTP